VPGVVSNGTDVGTVTWTPTTPGTYYYNCQYHATMNGVIVVREYTDDQKNIIQAAADKWSQFIADPVTVDVQVSQNLQSFSPGGVLAAAGPSTVDTNSFLTTGGEMHFDPEDLNGSGAALDTTIVASTTNSKMYYTALHEIGHILGIGTFWKIDFTPNGGENRNWLVNTDTGAAWTADADSSANTPVGYAGPPGGSAAIQQYNLITGNSYLYLPVEDDGGSGTALSHPEEGDGDTRTIGLASAPGLEAELMTGWIEDEHMPISAITLGFLEDLGWTVNYPLAESVTLQQ